MQILSSIGRLLTHALKYLAIRKFFAYRTDFITMVSNQSFLNPIIMSENLSPQSEMFPEPAEAKFKSCDIVYIKFNPNYNADYDWPCIGSSYFVDCKILDVEQKSEAQSPDGKAGWFYSIVTGKGYSMVNVAQRYIMSAADYNVLKTGQKFYHVAKEDTELFPKGAIFKLEGDYMVNREFEVYIHKTRFFAKLQNLFNKCSTSDKR